MESASFVGLSPEAIIINNRWLTKIDVEVSRILLLNNKDMLMTNIVCQLLNFLSLSRRYTAACEVVYPQTNRHPGGNIQLHTPDYKPML